MQDDFVKLFKNIDKAVKNRTYYTVVIFSSVQQMDMVEKAAQLVAAEEGDTIQVPNPNQTLNPKKVLKKQKL
jgi:hypothetical protein